MGGSSVETEAEPLDIETADMSRVTSGQECRRELEKKKKNTREINSINNTKHYHIIPSVGCADICEEKKSSSCGSATGWCVSICN